MAAEIEIIRRVLGGDADAFRPLVERYQRPVWSMVAHLAGDRHLCEDLVQDVFVTAFEKLAAFDPARREFSTWLFTIARNKAINAIKKRRPATAENPPDVTSDAGPMDTLARKELFAELDRALAALPAKLKAVFVMAQIEQLPYEQIAQIEAVSTGTVKSRVHRARKRLAKALQRYREHGK